MKFIHFKSILIRGTYFLISQSLTTKMGQKMFRDNISTFVKIWAKYSIYLKRKCISRIKLNDYFGWNPEQLCQK